MEEIKPREKSSGRRIIEGLLFFSVICILLSILFPVGSRSRESARRSSCQSNLKQIGLGFSQYIRDYDEKYPQVKLQTQANFNAKILRSSFGWADSIQPYLKSTQIYQCPSEANSPQTDPTRRNYTDYWFNARASGINLQQIFKAALTISLGDGNTGSDATNARYHLATIPKEWRKTETSPLYRHLDGANYAFADGHVKWFRADRWKNELDMTNGPTLRLKPTNQAVSK